jgi:hypothetical protein
MKIKIDPTETRSQVVIAIELLEALNQATGGAEQLAFHRRDPRYLLMRDGLSVLKNFCMVTLPRSIQVGERSKKSILV